MDHIVVFLETTLFFVYFCYEVVVQASACMKQLIKLMRNELIYFVLRSKIAPSTSF